MIEHTRIMQSGSNLARNLSSKFGMNLFKCQTSVDLQGNKLLVCVFINLVLCAIQIHQGIKATVQKGKAHHQIKQGNTIQKFNVEVINVIMQFQNEFPEISQQIWQEIHSTELK